MEHKITLLPKSEVELEVTLPFPEFEPHVSRAAATISEERDIEGFRRGKAPFDAVKSKFGESTIYERAAEHAVRKTYPAIIEECEDNPPEGVKEFAPIGAPEITIIKLAPGNELIYKATFSLMPSVELPDYKKIAAQFAGDKKEMEVTDDEIAKTLTWIAESRMEQIPVERSAKDGDAVEVDFVIRHDGVKWENGESRNHPLVVGKKTFIPGFEEHLAGMKTGDEKDFSLTLPEDWRDKALAGKTIDVHVKMNIVKERKIPEINDEFVKQLGAFENVEMLKKNISDGLLQEKQEKEKQRVRISIIEAIAREIKTEVPQLLVERELEKMFEELKNSIEQMGMKWEDYLLHINKNLEELRVEWLPQASSRVRVALALREISRKEHINPTAQEIQEKSNQYLKQFANDEDAHKQIDPDRLREYARGILKNEKVFEFLEKMG